jgi:uncharacterized membrane protein YcaP (DUF421 family)
MLNWVLEQVGGDDPIEPLRLGQIMARAAVVYISTLGIIRLGKSRLLAGSTPVDGILTFVAGALLGTAILGKAPLSSALVAYATLVAIHWAFTAIAYWSRTWGWLIKGEEHVLVSNGVINWRSMRRSHISEADLREEMRLNANVNDLEVVELAVKERSGSVSVVKKREAIEASVAS